MNIKYFMWLLAYGGVMFYLAAVAITGAEKIDFTDPANISPSFIREQTALVSPVDRKLHCQFGQVYFDGVHVERNLDAAFFHFFLCGKNFSVGGRRGSLMATSRQFRTLFKTDDILPVFETAKDRALIYVDDASLSPYWTNRVKDSVIGSYNNAHEAQVVTSSGKGFRVITYLMIALFIAMCLAGGRLKHWNRAPR